MIKVMIGGLLAISGGIAGTWIQSKLARRTRMDEIVAEKMVNAAREAYAHMLDIRSRLTKDSNQETLKSMIEHEEWFINNSLFFPGKFREKWSTLKVHLKLAARSANKLEKIANRSQNDADKLFELEEKCRRLADEAISEIEKEMKLSAIEIESPYGQASRSKSPLLEKIMEHVCRKYRKRVP